MKSNTKMKTISKIIFLSLAGILSFGLTAQAFGGISVGVSSQTSPGTSGVGVVTWFPTISTAVDPLAVRSLSVVNLDIYDGVDSVTKKDVVVVTFDVDITSSTSSDFAFNNDSIQVVNDLGAFGTTTIQTYSKDAVDKGTYYNIPANHQGTFHVMSLFNPTDMPLHGSRNLLFVFPQFGASAQTSMTNILSGKSANITLGFPSATTKATLNFNCEAGVNTGTNPDKCNKDIDVTSMKNYNTPNFFNTSSSLAKAVSVTYSVYVGTFKDSTTFKLTVLPFSSIASMQGAVTYIKNQISQSKTPSSIALIPGLQDQINALNALITQISAYPNTAVVNSPVVTVISPSSPITTTTSLPVISPATTTSGTLSCFLSGPGCPGYSTTSIPVALTPSVSLTVNGSHSVTVKPGDSVTYSWLNLFNKADKFSVNYTSDNVAKCTSGPSFIGKTASGTYSESVPSWQAGCNYKFTYTATESATGASFSDSVNIKVVSQTSFDQSKLDLLASTAQALEELIKSFFR